MSSTWSNLRYRSGDRLSATIGFLIQKSIDNSIQFNEIAEEDKIQPVVPTQSIFVLRDNRFRVRLRTITLAQSALLPKDPDGKELRLWLWNEHAGAHMSDHSGFDNIVEIEGTDSPDLVDSNDDDGSSGSILVCRFNDDQHLRVLDNSNVQLKEMAW